MKEFDGRTREKGTGRKAEQLMYYWGGGTSRKMRNEITKERKKGLG